MVKPTLYLSNWSSHRTPGHHGPGRKFTIMANPRSWERGGGAVHPLIPGLSDLFDVQQGRITVDEYRARFAAMIGRYAGHLPPGHLSTLGGEAVADGDTLCCACSRDEAAAGRCHRVWAAEALVRAGWRVVLDGVALDGAP